MLVDKRAILQCLGCLIKSPSLLEEYHFEIDDFESEPFYKIIFSCIYNLYYSQGVNTIDSFIIDSYLSNYEKQYKIFEDNNGIEYCNEATNLSELNNFEYYYSRVKKFSYLRFLEKHGVDSKFLYDSTVIEPSQQEAEMKKLDDMTINDMIDIVESNIVIESKIKFASDDASRGQLAGKGMTELKEKLKDEPEFGIPLYSPIMTTIARGARLKKIYVRSSSAGSGKSRTAIADICGMSIPWIYDLDTNEWRFTGFSEPSLFISTELEEDEVQTLIMAFISGVNESHILDGKYEEGEEDRVDKAIEYINSSPLYIEFINDFGIQEIVNIIKKYKREKGCSYFVFDYIHMSSKLITEVATMSKGMRLREDQILFLFIDTLKNLCNQLGIFILTMTQLNGTYKDSPIKDETMLRGSKSLADRIDLGEISLPPSASELESVQAILRKKINMPVPNLVRNIYKVRRGKLTRIKVWQYADLGVCRTKDLFVTTNDFKLIPVTATKVENIDKLVDEHSVNLESIQTTAEEETDAVQALFDW